MNALASDRRSTRGLFPGQPTPMLPDCAVEAVRSRHCGCRTEEGCLHWIHRLAFRGGTHPRGPAGRGIHRFLSHRAGDEKAPAPAHNRAPAGVLFLCQHVLRRPSRRGGNHRPATQTPEGSCHHSAGRARPRVPRCRRTWRQSTRQTAAAKGYFDDTKSR